MEGGRLVRVFPYHICVWNRLVTLPRDFMTDLMTLGEDALAFAFFMISMLWTQPGKGKVKIEITAATPEFEFLPDNHPLRKIAAQKILQEDTGIEEPESKLSGFLANIKRVVYWIAAFHWQFYEDLFTCLREGFSFLLYLVYPFPLELYTWLVGTRGESIAWWGVGVVTSSPRYAIQGVSLVADIITQQVEKVNMMVKKSQEGKDDEAGDSTNDGESKEKDDTKSKRATTSSKSKPQKQDYTIPKNPRTAGESGEVEEIVGIKQTFQKAPKAIIPISVPTKNIEAFKTEVKIQEEILKIGKEKARELFSDPVIVSGPWIREDSTLVPGHRLQSENLSSENISIEGTEKSGVFEQEKEPRLPVIISEFDAPIPTSSIFERDSTKSDFDLRAKINTPSPRNSFNTGSMEQTGVLALGSNIHTSMYNIHAACEDEDENIEELENLKEQSPEPDDYEYRNTDIEDIEDNFTENSDADLMLNPITDHGLPDASIRSSILSEAPRESPDLKARFSVKDEIAQLRLYPFYVVIIG